jgi:hypothetical protein
VLSQWPAAAAVAITDLPLSSNSFLK